MTDPTVKRSFMPKDTYHRLLVGYGATTLIPVIILLVYLVGSLLLTGAQVLPTGRKIYGAPIPFPLFVVPDWFSVALAIIAAALVVPLVVTTRAVHANHLVGMISYTFGTVIADVIFAFAFPGDRGLIPSPTDPDGTLGNHILGAAIAVVCAIVLIVRMFVLAPAYERMRKAGELPNGHW